VPQQAKCVPSQPQIRSQGVVYVSFFSVVEFMWNSERATKVPASATTSTKAQGRKILKKHQKGSVS